MKQKSFLMGVMILLMLTSLNFMACSDDEDVDNSISPSERKLITSIKTPRSFHKATYDDKNRLLSVDVNETNDWYDDYLEINYKTNTIVLEKGGTFNFTLNSSGYIETLTYNGNTRYYTYDDEGYLIDENIDGYHTVYEWKDGNLIRNYDEGISCEFEYNNMPNISGIYPHGESIFLGDLFMELSQNDLIWASNLFGKQSKNLISSSVYHEGSYVEKHDYTYRTNEDGYVISCTRDNEDITSYYYNE